MLVDKCNIGKQELKVGDSFYLNTRNIHEVILSHIPNSELSKPQKALEISYSRVTNNTWIYSKLKYHGVRIYLSPDQILLNRDWDAEENMYLYKEVNP